MFGLVATLIFDFQSINKEKRALSFRDPVEVFTTNDINEVKPLLKKMHAATESGDYLAGYLSYEAAPAFDQYLRVNHEPSMPLMWFGRFKKPTEVTAHTLDDGQAYQVSDWKIAMSYQRFQTRIDAIKAAIKAGDTYQVNYTTRMNAQFKGNSYRYYQHLKSKQQAHYSSYLDLGRWKILSLSPELFFEVNQQMLTTRPMKGTVKRGKTEAEDALNKAFLVNSDKERAENLMIVDLLRNDMGRIAKEGSVHVTKQLTVESYPTVHQMTSTIEATLKSETTPFDWFEALFPCGSVTGAPKIKTMSIISQLEEGSRDVYCGAIGYITPDNEAIFNVPIRTVVIDEENHTATYGVGGGITWDSTSAGEYEELRTKAKVLTVREAPVQLLESIKLENGTYTLLSEHLHRLKVSASYFNYPYDEKLVCKQLESFKQPFIKGDYKVRLLLDQSGKVNIEASALEVTPTQVKCYLAKHPIDRHNIFFYHKTTKRDIYQSVARNEADNYATLLYNDANEVTEFTIGNLVIKQGDQYFTPPVASGLLAGVYRQHLLREGKISEKVISFDDVKEAEAIYLINSVREWINVQIVIDS